MLIIDFKTEYLAEFKDSNTAYKLWIWYYYVTENYDRSLPHTVQSEFDKDTVIPLGESIGSSDRNAQDCYRRISNIAKGLEIDFDIMNAEKINLSKYKQKYIDEQYQYLKENGEFEFMEHVKVVK